VPLIAGAYVSWWSIIVVYGVINYAIEPRLLRAHGLMRAERACRAAEQQGPQYYAVVSEGSLSRCECHRTDADMIVQSARVY